MFNTIHQSILESVPEAVIFSDREGIIRIWNRGAEAAMGFSANDVLGQSLDMIIPEPFRKAHWDGYHRAIAHGSTKHNGGSMITRALHKNGQQIYIDVSFSIVKNPAGEVIGSAAIARDATDRFMKERAMNKQLAELMAKSSG